MKTLKSLFITRKSYNTDTNNLFLLGHTSDLHNQFYHEVPTFRTETSSIQFLTPTQERQTKNSTN